MGDGQRTWRHELAAMPGLAGFDGIRMLGDCAEDAATAASGILVSVAATA
jgi:hypothetical protein